MARRARGYLAAVFTGDIAVADIPCINGDPSGDIEGEANASLIAAAPDLLAACVALLAAFPAPPIKSRGGFEGNLAHATARSAIARATGGAS